MTRLAKEVGCVRCGTKTDIFYWIEYYILPTKLVRKRHRDRGQVAIYCRPCYEKEPELHFDIGGVPHSVPKMPPQAAQQQFCIACGADMGLSELYGIITSLLVMKGSGIDSRPLASLCQNCLEKDEVRFSDIGGDHGKSRNRAEG